MPKDLEPQLDEDDLELIRETRRDIHANRAVPVAIETIAVTGVNEFTGEPIGTPVRTTISGVVQAIIEEDRLLRLGGRIRTGDLKVTLLHQDVVDSIGLGSLHEAAVVYPASGGRRYSVDVVEEAGLGRSSRVDLGLVLL